MHTTDVLGMLRELGDPDYLAGMKRYGIDCSGALGVKVPELRRLARILKTDHALALGLWKTGVHEARILASMVDDPARVTPAQMERWTHQFTSWDICDQVCGNLFDRTPYALDYAAKFTADKPEFVKRAGFVLIAESAVHQKSTPDQAFVACFPLIEREASDERNFVKKAVNWALRQIGKRNESLKKQAISCADRMLLQESRSARWIARDALRELKAR